MTNKTNGWTGGEQFNWIAWDGSIMYYSTEWTTESSKATTADVLPDGTIFYYQTIDQIDAALGTGGAITIFGANATIENTNFTGGSARLGGGVYVGAYSGNTIFNKTIFRSNTAYERGGAVNLLASGVHIYDGQFYDNKAINGSGVYVGGIGTRNVVHESIFEGNNATGYGAGIYWVAYEGEIVNSTFNDNSAKYGGGIYLNGKSANTNITNTTFKGNNAIKNGGAIECNASNIGIYNLVFDANTAGEYGAALCRESGATGGHGINNTFKNNYAGISGAALAWLGVDNINIYNYTFINNGAGRSAGAIFIDLDSDNCTIDYCNFEKNYAEDNVHGHGGAIGILGNTATIINSNFTKNTAYEGGAIFGHEGSGNTTINNVTFKQNEAYTDGGAINLQSSAVYINNTRYYGNIAGGSGGAVYVGGIGTTNSIHLSVFEDNIAGDHGGAIDWLASAGEIIDSNFTRNSADYGGAVYLNGISSNSSIRNVIFKQNHANFNGGAIDSNATVTGLINVSFIENSADAYGGALCREINATGGFGSNNTFISNTAGISGGALAWLHVKDIVLNYYTFIDNTAGVSGGAIYISPDSDNALINNSIFKGNNATNGHGGAIDIEARNVTIINATFERSVSKNGGAIYVDEISSTTSVINSTFTSCEVSLGDGGAISWKGDNGLLYNVNFTSSSSSIGGAVAWYGNNGNITNAIFLASFARDYGGAIAGFDVENMTINNVTFRYSVSAGAFDIHGVSHGDGGAIYWENGTNLKIYNSTFYKSVSQAYGASISLCNSTDVIVYNATFDSEEADYGAIAIRGSDNVTIKLTSFNYTGSIYNGGAIYVLNSNATIADSIFSDTKAAWGDGGAIYIIGNVNMTNLTFTGYSALNDKGEAIFIYAGNSTISESTFIGPDAIWINKDATAYIIKNNITGPNPNKDITYLDKNYTDAYRLYDYSIWNDGTLYLENNTFDYILFNNGTIETNTTTWILSNETWNETWNETFTFYANIVDDNNNTVISVSSLITWNDVFPDADPYPMAYNALPDTLLAYQGNFTIFAKDDGLKKNKVYFGSINVRLPTEISISYTNIGQEDITFTVKVRVPVQSNYTFDTSKLFVDINGIPITNLIFYGFGDKWIVAYANFTQHHLPVGTYTITANYLGDDFHMSAENSTTISLFSRPILIAVHADDIFWGQPLIVNVTSNATNTVNGRILISINGKVMSVPIHLNPDGSYIYYLPNENYTALLEPGMDQVVSVIFTNGTYWETQSNSSTFNVYKLNTTINATTTDSIYGKDQIINVSVNKTATGYIVITIGKTGYLLHINENGTVQFNISGLAPGRYENVPISYSGDNHFFENTTNITFTVDPTEDFNITVKVDNITYGKNATVSVLVATGAVGNVTFWVDGVNRGTVNLTRGVATLDISGLAGGEHVVNVTYNGDSRYVPKDKNGTMFKVDATDDWKMTLRSTQNPYGEYTTIYVSALPYYVSGSTVRIVINDTFSYVVDFIDYNATLSLNNLSAGIYSAYVEYMGDANYSYKKQFFSLNIVKATPSVTLIQNGTDVIAAVSGNVTGNVTFSIHGTQYTVDLVNGSATLVNNLTPGSSIVVAQYNGDNNYTISTGWGTFDVDLFNTTIVVNASNIKYGEDEIINVTVNETATGYIIVTIDNNRYLLPITKGKVLFNISGLAPGRYENVLVEYSGDDNFYSNSTVITFTVNPTDNFTIDVKVDNITYGKNATVSVLVATGAVGNVTFWVDGVNRGTVNLTRGVATLDISGLAGGEHVVNVTYNGDSRYVPKDKNGTMFKVDATDDWKMTLRSTQNPYGEYTTIYVSALPYYVSGSTVRIVINDTFSYVVDFIDYNATLSLNNLSAGIYSAYVEYMGDANYSYKKQFFSLNIVKATPSVTLIQNGTDVIAAVSGNVTGNVTFSIHGTQYTVDLVNGSATLVNNLTPGSSIVVAQYNGDNNYTISTGWGTFDVVKNNITVTMGDVGGSIVVGTPVSFNVTLNETVSGDVVFTINGANYTVCVVNANYANYTYTPTTNATISVVATFVGNNKYNSNSTSKEFNVNRVPTNISVEFITPVFVGSDAVIIIKLNESINGTVELTIDDKDYDVAVVNGVGTYIASNLVNGTYSISAKFTGDVKYSNCTSSVETLEVNKVATNISVVVNSPVKVGEIAVVTINMGPTINAAVRLTVGGKSYDVAVVNGVGLYNITGLGSGNYVVNVTYAGDNKYVGSKNSTVLVVNNTVLVANVTALDVSVEQNTSFVINVTDGFNGNVSIKVGDDVLYNGTVKTLIIADKLFAGDKVATVVFYGDSNYDELILNNVGFTVFRVDPSIEVSIPDVTYPGNATATITVGNNANGTVNITVDTIVFSGIVTNGVAKVNLTGLSGGLKEAEVEFFYGDNDNYNNDVTATVVFTVNKNTSSIVIDVGSIYRVGDDIVIKFITTNSSGAVGVTINGKSYVVVNKNVTVVGGLEAGEYIISAVLAGDENYTGSNANETFNVVKNNITVTIEDVGGSIVVGTPVCFNVTLNETVSGDVVFTINGANYTVCVVNANYANYTYTPTTNATISVVATFVGNNKYNSNSTSKEFNVNRVPTNISVEFITPVFVGSDAVIIIKLNESINGTVELTIDDKDYDVAVVNGVGTYIASNLVNGTYSISAEFTGDVKYSNSTSSVETLEVNKVPTNVTIKLDKDVIFVGENAVVNVVVNQTVNTSVIVTVNGQNYTVAIVNGKGKLTLYDLINGTYEINATFAGDDEYMGNVSSDLTLEVNKIATDISVVVNSPIKVGESAVVTINMNPTINATVKLTVDGKSYDVAIVNGMGLYNVSGLANKTYRVDVDFAGDVKYSAATNNTTLKVNKITDYEIKVTSTDINFGDNETIVIVLPADVNSTKLVVNVDGINRAYNMINGVATIIIPGLIVGDHIVNVTYLGDNNYVSKDNNGTKFTVYPSTTYDLILVVENHTYGENTVFTVTLPSDVTKNVTIAVDGINYVSRPNAHGVATLTLNNLTGGLHLVTATYPGDGNYSRSSKSATFIIPLATSSIDVNFTTPELVGDNVLINVTMPQRINGTVILSVGDNNYTVTIVNGNGSYVVSGLTNATHTIKAVFAGNENYTASASEIKYLAINKVPTTITVVVNETIKVGEIASANITIDKKLNGSAIVTVNGQNYTVAIINGNGILLLNNLANGTYNITATFAGDNRYEGNTSTTKQLKVNKVPTNLSISLDKNSIIVGDKAVVSIVLNPSINAIVTVWVNDENYTVAVVNGKGDLTLYELARGTYTIDAAFAGDDKYVNSTSNSLTLTVEGKTVPDISVEVNVTNSTVTVELPSDATGNVTVKIDGVEHDVIKISEVPIVIDISDVKPGNHTIEVIYSGDDEYTSASESVYFEVPKIKNYTLDVIAEDIYVGEKTNITIILPENINGTVLIDIDGIGYYTNVINGHATLNLALMLEPGTYEAVVTFDGNDIYDSNTASDSFKVLVDITPMSVDVVDDKIIITLPEDATGNVIVTINGEEYMVSVENGKAVMNIPDLNPGNYTIDVFYNGDEKYPSAYNSTTIEVPRIDDYSINMTNTDDKLVVSVPDDATGNVTVNIDGVDYTVPIKKGTAVMDISDLPSGKHNVTVTYPGNDKYASKSVNETIRIGPELILTAHDVVKYYHGPERFVVYVIDSDGKKLTGITVKITVNGVTYEKTSADGIVSLALNLDGGNYTVKVVFDGNKEFEPQTVYANVEIMPTIYAHDVLKVFRNDTQYHALFLDSKGNPLVNTDVTFSINSVLYTRTTNESGWAKLNINLDAGKYILTAYNPVTGESHGNNVTVFSLIESGDLVKHYRNDSQFVIRIRGEDGEWAKAGEEVTFNINGVFYTRYSNETGHVKLNINLDPGNYVVTSYYKDCSEGNNITVLPRLVTSDLVMKYQDGSKFVAVTLDEQGNIAPSQEVSFNVDGILYTCISNDNGEAAMTIDLGPGEYLMTSQYLTENHGNKIIVEA